MTAAEGKPLFLRPFERPRDRVFEASISSLGLLGAALVEDVAYVYGNIAAFRLAFELVTTHHSTLASHEIVVHCSAAMDALDRAVSRGESLIDGLKCRADKSFFGRGA